jgi:hypothetical protein
MCLREFVARSILGSSRLFMKSFRRFVVKQYVVAARSRAQAAQDGI